MPTSTPTSSQPDRASPFDDQPSRPDPVNDEAESSTAYQPPAASWNERAWASRRQQEKRTATWLGAGALCGLWLLEAVAWGNAQILGHVHGTLAQLVLAGLSRTTWWGVWAFWTLLALVGLAGLGLTLLLGKVRPSPYKFPNAYTHGWLGREAWRDLRWSSVSRRWTWGNLVAGVPPGMLVIGLIMSLVTGFQTLVALGVNPALNPHTSWLPTVLRAQGAGGATMALLGVVNLGLPTGLVLGALGLMWDGARHDLCRLCEHWTLYSTEGLRAQSPIWRATLNEDWDTVNALPLDRMAQERRSARGGSLLTQAMLLKAPMRTVQHLLDAGCDPQRSWTPWQPDRSLDEEVRHALAHDFDNGANRAFRPKVAWNTGWRDAPMDVDWSFDELTQVLGVFERHALRASLPPAAPNVPPGSTVGPTSSHEVQGTGAAPLVLPRRARL